MSSPLISLFGSQIRPENVSSIQVVRSPVAVAVAVFQIAVAILLFACIGMLWSEPTAVGAAFPILAPLTETLQQTPNPVREIFLPLLLPATGVIVWLSLVIGDLARPKSAQIKIYMNNGTLRSRMTSWQKASSCLQGIQHVLRNENLHNKGFLSFALDKVPYKAPMSQDGKGRFDIGENSYAITGLPVELRLTAIAPLYWFFAIWEQFVLQRVSALFSFGLLYALAMWLLGVPFLIAPSTAVQDVILNSVFAIAVFVVITFLIYSEIKNQIFARAGSELSVLTFSGSDIGWYTPIRTGAARRLDLMQQGLAQALEEHTGLRPYCTQPFGFSGVVNSVVAYRHIAKKLRFISLSDTKDSTADL